jgi:RNA recognition motif-containing protein
MNIYVGNLSWQTTEADIRQAFEAYGAVSSVAIITDKNTGESRGFGFVEMASQSEAQAAIQALNGVDLGGRTLTVNEARPREERSGGGGNRGGGFDRRRSGPPSGQRNNRRW